MIPLIVFEDARWRNLRPLTDLAPVPALALGASTLTDRLARAFGAPLHRVIARPDAVAACRAAAEWTALDSVATNSRGIDRLLLANAAAMPGPWATTVKEAREAERFVCGGRVVAAVVSASALPSLERAGDLEAALRAQSLPERAVEARFLEWPWQVVEWNASAITEDLEGVAGTQDGDVHPSAVLLEPGRIRIEPGARVDPLVVLDARQGPILIRAGALIAPHTHVVGPCVVGRGTQLLGGMIGRSTFGPECRVAGEIEECVWQGYGNKRHHGFVGHSVFGEWVNLGALTTTSDLKNNYGPVRMWAGGERRDTGSSKVGSIVGAHVKTGIGTLLPTGASIGAGSNLFGGGRFAPPHVPPFTWWDGQRTVDHKLEEFLATAKTTAGRRGHVPNEGEVRALCALWEATAAERRCLRPRTA